MKLSEYIEKLQEIYEEDGDLDCIYSSDEEGNNFGELRHDPSVGNFNESRFGPSDFTPIDLFEEYEEEYDKKLEINCVCIN